MENVLAHAVNVYELSESTEYSFDTSHCLYLTQELAIEAGKKLCARSRLEEDQPNHPVSVIHMNDDCTYVLKGEWTLESFNAWIEEENAWYWWYREPFSHNGAFGVFKRPVLETVEAEVLKQM